MQPKTIHVSAMQHIKQAGKPLSAFEALPTVVRFMAYAAFEWLENNGYVIPAKAGRYVLSHKGINYLKDAANNK